MKKIILLLTLLFAFNFLNAQVWTVNSCSTSGSTAYGPMYSVASANATNRTAVIYPSSQLSALAGKLLTNIYYKRNTTTGTLAGAPNFKIYLKEVASTDWGAGNLTWSSAITGATLVYDGNPVANVGTNDGWKSFPISTAFTYSGTQNLAVITEYNNPTVGLSGVLWEAENVAPCVDTANSNTSKYTNNITGTLPTDLTTSNFRRPLIGFDYPVACPAPTVLTATGATSNSVNLNWTVNGTEAEWAYSIQPQGTGIPTGAGTQAFSNPYTAGGLNPATSYEVYVRATCGTGNNSLWCGPVNFSTLCVPVTTYPHLEPFDNFVPSLCWTEADNGDLTAGPAIMGSGIWVADGLGNLATTGAFRMTLDALGDNDWVISPQFTIPATGYELKYFASANQAALTSAPSIPWESDDFVEVLVSNTGYSNWTVLYTHNDSNVPSNVGTPNIIDLDAYAGQTVRFAYRGVEGPNNGTASIDFIVDNFLIRPTPSCMEPTDLSVGNLTGTSADISWNLETGVVGYQYVLDNVATNPAGSGTFTTSNFYSASSLTGLTTYYLHVRTECSTGIFSEWSTITFTTGCAPILTFPQYENFNTFLPTICWTEANNGDLVAGPAALINSGWIGDGFANVGSTGAMRVTIDAASDNAWVISPQYTIPAVGYELKVLAAATQNGSLNAPTTPWESDDFVEVLISSTGYTNWTVLYTYNNTNIPTIAGVPNVMDLDAYAGQTVRFAFRAKEGATDGAAAIDFFIDDFEIKETALASDSFDVENFVAYPNPVNDVLSLSYKSTINNVKVVNLLGQEVLNVNTNAKDVQVDMSSLPVGAYIVNIVIENAIHAIKVIKQ